MTRIGLLEGYLRMARYNMRCYADNMLGSKAKAGKENEFNGYAEECEVLEAWLNELRDGERKEND